MRQDTQVRPGRGIGPIELGTTAEELVALLGPPRLVRGQRTWFEDGVSVGFGDDGRTRFIELSRSESAAVLFAGLDVHRDPAERVVELARSLGTLDEHHPGLGHMYVFPDIQLALWRPTAEGCFQTVAVASDGYFAST